ncbi:MAG: hypothetical protein SGILL_006027 [Bacillariaceae sp.]
MEPILSGTLRNLVVLIQWKDHKDRVLPSPEELDVLMNHEGPHALCPSGSVRDVYLENSQGALDLQSVITPWILVDNTEAYYANGDSGMNKVIRNAIKYALTYLDDHNMVDFDYFDQDNSGKIDAITLLHSGYAAEFGGTDSNGQFYENRIWSHKWGLYDGSWYSKSGVQVRDYHISPALWGTSGSGIGRIGVISHELGHFLGLPDLYDKNGGGRGIGSYGLMCNSWGWDGSQYYPPHLSAWAKWKLGWVEAIEPKEGTNLIEAIQHESPIMPQMYIIREGFPEREFLLIENRQRIGYDKQMAQGGILIWHIDEGNGGNDFRDSLSREGYPGQAGWPENGNHYGVALLQADGFYELEKGHNQGDYEDVFHEMGVDELIPCQDPDDCQYPNTDSYLDGVIARSNVWITHISSTNKFMSFQYHHGGEKVTDSPSVAPSSAPTDPDLFGCGPNQVHLEVEFMTDGYPLDNKWTLVNVNTGKEVAAVTYELGRHKYFYDACLEEAQLFKWELYDDWGDALCCEYGEGYYTIRLDGIDTFEGSQNFKGTKWVSHQFSTGTTEAPSMFPTVMPSQSPSEAPSSPPSSAPSLCTCTR